MSRLRDLSDLAALQQPQELTLDACPKLTNLRALSALSSLRTLDLTDCPRLESVEPLAALKLQRLSLSGSTSIGDGDTTPLSNVVELFYQHRKHYNTRIPTPIQDGLIEENRRKILGLGS